MAVDAKLSAAKGAACFGTAGWHSQVCVMLCMMEFEAKLVRTTARAVAFCVGGIVSFEIIRVSDVCHVWQRAAGPTVSWLLQLF